MGGSKTTSKSTPTQTTQSTAALGGANTAASGSQSLANTFGAQQAQLYNLLYGMPGTGATPGAGTASGVISSMLNPANLNVTKPTGVYALQNTNANDAAAKQYANNASAIKSSAQQAGFGPNTPSGFVQSEQNQNRNALADTVGRNFSNATTSQYQDTLNNFWKGAGMAQGAASSAGSGALQGNSSAANTYSNLYGRSLGSNTTGTQSGGTLNALIGAGGQVGAAAVCLGLGTMIRRPDGTETCVEDLKKDDIVIGVDGPVKLIAFPESTVAPVMEITTEYGENMVCSLSHTLLLPKGGYVIASDLEPGMRIRTWGGTARVHTLERKGHRQVVRIRLNGSHTYCSNGIWSEE